MQTSADSRMGGFVVFCAILRRIQTASGLLAIDHRVAILASFDGLRDENKNLPTKRDLGEVSHCGPWGSKHLIVVLGGVRKRKKVKQAIM